MKKKTPSIVKLVLAYINPVKYPFYVIILLGIITLVDVSNNNIIQDKWYFITCPIFVAMVLSLYLAFLDSQSLENRRAYEFQMKLARMIGIIVPFVCFIVVKDNVLKNENFLWLYLPCIIQIFVFIVFAFIAIKNGKEYFSKFNFIQLAMITTSLIVGITYCSINYVHNLDEKKEINFSKQETQALSSIYNFFQISIDEKITDKRLIQISSLLNKDGIGKNIHEPVYKEREKKLRRKKEELKQKKEELKQTEEELEQIKELKSINNKIERYKLLLIGFTLLWTTCQLKWVVQITRSIKIVTISINIDERDKIMK